ncbi:sensor histidine kinase [Kribbella italica]|uniref:histidine kinase n=1 Tax=Kribbella italica TaxID=1540520 RepID=A0A7W9MU53_9ACTN|nr:histidine kinase [Kribbella italica]MBB5836476.1 signal transduction histidine kinase [Kribbella italica]
MLTKILTRGWPACVYLFARYLVGMVTVAATPIGLLLSWAIPGITAGLVQAANSERRTATEYLGLPEEPPLPEAADRKPGDVVTLVKDRSFRRSLRIIPLSLLTIPGLLVAVTAVFAVPSALLGMFLWKAAPGEFTLMGFPVDSWLDALTLGPAQALIGVGVMGWGAPAAARGYARGLRRLLAPSPAELETAQLAQRVEELTRSRAGAVDSHGAELRRIERDLHDGTQAQLVSLAMRIGVAKQLMADDPEKAAKLLDDARDGAEQAMTELRGVLRTMYPPILQDRGLTGAVAALTARCPIPVDLRMGALGDVPAAVEAAAYFVVAESLTNIAKHSAAGRAEVQLERRGAELYLAITDDGIGGARVGDQPDLLGRGSGLRGMMHRVEAIDGHLELTSPIGGPTTVEVVLPCGS